MTTEAARRARANAAAAIARVNAHIPPPPTQTEDERLAEIHPYVSTTRARQIRLEAQENHHAGP